MGKNLSSPATPRGGQPLCRLVHGDPASRTQSCVLDTPRATIGRGQSCTLRLDLLDISRVNTMIRFVDGQHRVSDLGSRHGTRLNGQILTGEQPLAPADVIGLGEKGRHEVVFDLVESRPDEEEPAVMRSAPRRAAVDLLPYREVLPGVLRALASTLDLDALLSAVLDAALRITRADQGAVFLDERGELRARASRWPGAEAEGWGPIAELARETWLTGSAQVFTGRNAGQLQPLPGTTCMHVFAMRVFEGERWGADLETVASRAIGVLAVASTRTGRALSRSQRDFLQTILDLAALHVLNARLFDAAMHDSLTGLFNRGAFDRHAARLFALATETNRPLSIVLLDLDHFKRLNDTRGHAVGDAALRDTARCLASLAGPGAMAARVGGEEFALLLSDTRLDEALSVAERVRAGIAEMTTRDDNAAPVTVSAGVACGPTTSMDHVAALIHAADIALYASKRDGRNRVTAYDVSNSSSSSLHFASEGPAPSWTPARESRPPQ